MKSIVLLGGTGFLGDSLVRKMTKENFKLKVMVHDKKSCSKVIFFKGDILSSESLAAGISNVDTVINLVGQYDGNISRFVDLNIIGGLNILNMCLRKKIKNVLLISSINVYGNNTKKPSKEEDDLNPKTIYGMVKLATENLYEYYSKRYGMNITIMRLSNLYGPGKKFGLVSNLIKSANGNKIVKIYHNGHQYRDFLYIDDAIDPIIKAVKYAPGDFNVFNISSGKRYLITDMIHLIEKILDKNLKLKFHPYGSDELCIWANNSKAKKVLDFNPKITIEDGLKITINELMKQKRS